MTNPMHQPEKAWRPGEHGVAAPDGTSQTVPCKVCGERMPVTAFPSYRDNPTSNYYHTPCYEAAQLR